MSSRPGPYDPKIPVVELPDLTSHEAAITHRAADALQHAFGLYGLVYVRNHGVDTAALERLYRHFGEFTARPEEEKRRFGRADIWYQRGWTPPNTERAVVAGGQPDFKECYFAAPELLDPVASRQYPQIYAENVWPEGAREFRELYLSLGHQLHRIGLQLLRGCALALGLEPYRFEALIYGGPHVTRILKYLALDETQVGTDILWGEEHTDFNLLTLLPGGRFFDPQGERCGRPDPACGLYLRTRATPAHPTGRMVSGQAPEGCLVAQVGQQLEILTGGTFLATPHIIRPPRAPGYTRMALAHFLHVHAHQVLYPLEPFRNPDTVIAYSPPVLAGTYGVKTLVDIGLAPASALHQLGYRHYDRLDSMRRED